MSAVISNWETVHFRRIGSELHMTHADGRLTVLTVKEWEPEVRDITLEHRKALSIYYDQVRSELLVEMERRIRAEALCRVAADLSDLQPSLDKDLDHAVATWRLRDR